MASEAVHTTVSYEDLNPAIEVSAPASVVRPARTFAGLTMGQIAIAGLALLCLIWGMWTTREVLALRQHKVVSVRLGELVNQFALAEARSGDEPEKVEARTRAFMGTLDKVLKERANAGDVVLVGEAVVSSSTQDITSAVAAEVASMVPMPVALALPPHAPVASVAPVAPTPLEPSPTVMGVSALPAEGSPFTPPPSPYGAGGGDPSGQGPDNAQQ